MFKKKKNKIKYQINVYKNDDPFFSWAYDVHLDGKLVAHGEHSTINVAKDLAEYACRNHSKLGKYIYEV